MPPEILDRIQFWRIGRKPFPPPSPFLSGYKISYQMAAVTRQSVPDHSQLPWQMRPQMFEKLDDLPWRAEGRRGTFN